MQHIISSNIINHCERMCWMRIFEIWSTECVVCFIHSRLKSILAFQWAFIQLYTVFNTISNGILLFIIWKLFNQFHDFAWALVFVFCMWNWWSFLLILVNKKFKPIDFLLFWIISFDRFLQSSSTSFRCFQVIII